MQGITGFAGDPYFCLVQDWQLETATLPDPILNEFIKSFWYLDLL